MERIDVLRHNVGGGKLEGKCEVNQRYAAYQHFLPELHHPDGGSAYYLRDPFYADHGDYLKHFADKLLADEGRGGSQAMMDGMEKLSDRVFEKAPWEFADLRASGHPSVERDGVVLHDRAPHCARLSDAELREKSRLSRLLDPRRYAREDAAL